jgi:hypothetical protein
MLAFLGFLTRENSLSGAIVSRVFVAENQIARRDFAAKNKTMTER